MGKFVGDMNQSGFFYESGTYANPTGASLQWLGQVKEVQTTLIRT